jgi:hypothetical protein
VRLAALALLAASCGGAAVGPVGVSDKHQDIAVLWAQIRDWSRDAKIQLDPGSQVIAYVRGKTVSEERAVCPAHHDVPPVCNDSCNLSDAICDNAEQICKIADELGKDDDYAQGKCDSAKASCREGKQECCKCSDQGTQP